MELMERYGVLLGVLISSIVHLLCVIRCLSPVLPYDIDTCNLQREVPTLRIIKQLPSRKKTRLVPVLSASAVLVLFVTLACLAQSSGPALPLLAAKCVEFVQTRGRTLDGPPVRVLPCDHAHTRREGGYCVCGDSKAVLAHPSVSSRATCESLCFSSPVKEAISIPSSTSCPPGTPDFFQWPLAAQLPQRPSSSAAAAIEWWLTVGGSLNMTDLVALPPGPRNKTHDFVAKKLSMEAGHIAHVREQWRSFSWAAEAAGSPVDTFNGRGVAILAGSAPYLVPALVALKALRKAGCTLPVEMWLPQAEAPSADELAELQRDMRQLGAHLLVLPVPEVLAGQAGYYLKAVVMAVSSFREVLFLDADNVPVRDPTPLFLSQEFQSTGALFWRDFWDASWAPDAAAVLGVSPAALPSYTIDSGQMLVDKARQQGRVRCSMWQPLVSALFFNIHGFLFYPLFTNYMGLGDKETFAFAMIAHGAPYSVAPYGCNSLGIVEHSCGVFGCRDKLYTNTIVQRDPQGLLLFLHTNMKPKWTMAVPADFAAAVRRWQVLSPGHGSLFDDFLSVSYTEFGSDLEKDMHEFLMEARCHDSLRNLTAAQEAAPPSLPWHIPQLGNERLPSKPWNTELLQTFEDPGLTGEFLKDYPPSWLQRLKHHWNKHRFGKAAHWNGTRSELVARSDVYLWRDHW